MLRAILRTLFLPLGLLAGSCGDNGPPPGPAGPYPGGPCTEWDESNHIKLCYGNDILHCAKDSGLYVWKYEKTCGARGCADGHCL